MQPDFTQRSACMKGDGQRRILQSSKNGGDDKDEQEASDLNCVAKSGVMTSMRDIQNAPIDVFTRRQVILSEPPYPSIDRYALSQGI